MAPTRREEVLAALAALETRAGRQIFTVREVYAEMVAIGTKFAESTVFKTMQRMKESANRPPFIRLKRVRRQGFRVGLAG